VTYTKYFSNSPEIGTTETFHACGVAPGKLALGGKVRPIVLFFSTSPESLNYAIELKESSAGSDFWSGGT